MSLLSFNSSRRRRPELKDLIKTKLPACVYIYIPALGLHLQVAAAAVEGSNLVLFVDVSCHGNGDVRADLTEVCREVDVKRRVCREGEGDGAEVRVQRVRTFAK
jgi:hypothetical protein